MLQGSSIKAFVATTAAALCAGVVVIVLTSGMSQKVEARTPTVGVKSDRLDIGTLGANCSQRGWPYYETACLRDRSQAEGRARTVRLVSTDRLAP